MAAIPLRHDVEYPESDGQPMGESTLHREVMAGLIQVLGDHYLDVPDVWVGGNLFLYYEEGNPLASVCPDVLVVQGVAKWPRRIYKLWEEGRVPSLIIEVTSEKTRHEDVVGKQRLYQRLGVEEYFLFDPEGDYLDPRLQGYRLEKGLEKGSYRPLEPRADGALASRTTGLILRPEGVNLRLKDSAIGEPLLWHAEIRTAWRAAEEKVRQEAAARHAAEEEARQEAEARHAAEEEARREAEARRAAEERIRALEAELARLRSGP